MAVGCTLGTTLSCSLPRSHTTNSVASFDDPLAPSWLSVSPFPVVVVLGSVLVRDVLVGSRVNEVPERRSLRSLGSHSVRPTLKFL